MTNIKYIVDVQNNTISEIEMTEEELALETADQELVRQNRLAQEAAEAEAKAAEEAAKQQAFNDAVAAAVAAALAAQQQ
jgi:anthranilate phosphoribosyltransferase